MISALGVHPEIQNVLLRACFSNKFSYEDFSYLDDLIHSDSLSAEQLRILPLLYKNIDLQRFSKFTQSRISGIYKHTLYRNTLLLDRAHQFAIQVALEGYGTPIFLKGIPNLLSGPKDIGIRPMADIDLLIPELWQKLTSFNQWMIYSNAQLKGGGIRSVTFKSKEGFEFDVHWYLHDFALRQHTVDLLVRHLQYKKYRGVTFMVPCPEHHLAHLIAHGMATPTLTYDARWVFDVLFFLQNNQELRIDLFKEFCDDFCCPNLVADGINLIVKELPSHIEFNRDLMLLLSNSLRVNSSLLDYLFKQTPIPNIPIENRSPKLSEWLLNIFRQFVNIYFVSRHNQISLAQSFVLTFSNGIETHFNHKFLIRFLNKILKRLPFMFLGIWIRPKN